MLSNTIVAMLVIGTIAIIALLKGLDSSLVIAAITGIAGLAGYELGKPSSRY